MNNFEISPVKNKKIKQYLPYIIAGLIVGIIFYFVNRSNSTRTIEPATTDTSAPDTAGMINSIIADNQQQLQNIVGQYTQQLQDLQKQQQAIDEAQNQSFANALAQVQEQINKQSEQYQQNFETISKSFNQSLQQYSSNFASQLTQTINELKSSIPNTLPTVSTPPTTTKAPLQNQIEYLQNLRKTGSEGERKWANQSQYLINLATTTEDKGTKNWAINQLSQMGYSQSQLSQLGIK